MHQQDTGLVREGPVGPVVKILGGHGLPGRVGHLPDADAAIHIHDGESGGVRSAVLQLRGHLLQLPFSDGSLTYSDNTTNSTNFLIPPATFFDSSLSVFSKATCLEKLSGRPRGSSGTPSCAGLQSSAKRVCEPLRSFFEPRQALYV